MAVTDLAAFMDSVIESRSGRQRSARPASAPIHPDRAPVLSAIGIAAFIGVAFGWSRRDEFYVVPDEGLGYALGILGLALMLLLLLYSLRKRWSLLRDALPIRHWFHVHMALGILGPTAILYHSNFHLGSLNANVALVCMLVVSASGFVGRLIELRA